MRYDDGIPERQAEDMRTIKARRIAEIQKQAEWINRKSVAPVETSAPVRARRDGRHVICVETGEQFPSVLSAADAADVYPMSIRGSCEIGYAVHGKHYQWEGGPVRIAGSKSQPVLCITTGERFAMVKEIIGTDKRKRMQLLRAIRRGKPFEGKMWKYVDNTNASPVRRVPAQVA